MPTTGWSSCGERPAKCWRACSTSDGAAPSNRAPNATSSCARAWPVSISSTSATRRSTSAASIASPSQRRTDGQRPLGARRVVPHRSVGRLGPRPRAPGRGLAGAGGRAVLPGHRSRSAGPRPPPSSRRAWPERCSVWRTSTSSTPTAAAPRPPVRSPSKTDRRGDRDPGDGERLLSDGIGAGRPRRPPLRARPGPHRAHGRHRRRRSSASRTRSSGRRSAVCSSSRAARERARPPSPCTGPPTCSTRTGSRSERQGVLVVGPNPLFLRYIEQVLPSLGETGVSLSTVAGLVPEVRVRGVDDPAVAKLKGDVRMVKVLARAVRTRQRPLRRDVEVPFGAGRAAPARADDRGDRRHGEAPPGDTQRAPALRRGPGGARARRRVPRTARARRGGARRRGAEPGGAGRPGAASAAGPRGRRGAGPHVAAPLAARVPPRPARRAAAAGGRWQGHPRPPTEVQRLYRPRSTSLDAVPWTVGDTALIDEARTLLGPRRGRAQRAPAAQRTDEGTVQRGGVLAAGTGGLAPARRRARRTAADDEIRSFGHIVVDEVQDLSPMQLRMLARRSLSGSMTVVGDIAQATVRGPRRAGTTSRAI